MILGFARVEFNRLKKASVVTYRQGAGGYKKEKSEYMVTVAPWSEVMRQLGAVILDGSLQRLSDAGAGFPAEFAADECVVRIKIADVDFLPIRRILFHRILSATGDLHEHARQSGQAHPAATAEIVDGADRFGSAGGKQKGLHGIVHIGEVAQLISTPHFEGFATQDLFDPDADEGLPCVLHPHVRADGVGEAQYRAPDAMHLAVEEVVLFAGQLVDAVDIDGLERMLFVHGQILRPAIE